MRAGSRQSGAILLGALVAVAILALLLMRAVERLNTQIQRANEAQLLFAGDQIRQAILGYYNGGPAGGFYPKSLNDLLDDERMMPPRHWLRQLYPDPMTRSTHWGLIKGTDDTIIGVYSLSKQTPLKQRNFPLLDKDFENKQSYKDWAFTANPTQGPPAQ